MNTPHTPGPWVFAYGSVYVDRDNLTDANAIRIAMMDRGDSHTTPTERDSNARLIAAAPDLLKALQTLLATVNVRIDDTRIAVFDQARAAISKATQSQEQSK